MIDQYYINPLTRRRLALGLTQEQLARLVGLDRTTISKLENNHRHPFWVSKMVADRISKQLFINPISLQDTCDRNELLISLKGKST